MGQKIEPDAKVVAVIGDLSKEEAIDLLDTHLGVTCYDNVDIDDVRGQVRQAYLDGKIEGPQIVMDYF